MIINGGKKRIDRKTLYGKYNQPTIKTWIQKMATTHVQKQMTDTWKIHTQEQQNATQIINTWRNKWLLRKKLHTHWEKKNHERNRISHDTQLHEIHTHKEKTLHNRHL